jgi:uncharacterized protein YukE
MSWVGPAPLELGLPPELAAVDPGALRRRATEHRADSEALLAQAGALRAAVVRLVPAAWLGLGGLSFASAALLQAGSLERIATAGSDLAAALGALAAALDSAREAAQGVIRAGDGLDAEVAADNVWLARRPEPERPDVDPGHLEAQFVAARAFVTRLAVAEDAARCAWRQAEAAFDLVAYRMPDLMARMSGAASDGWRPSSSLVAVPQAQWRSLVGLSPVCVDAGYAGSGLLLGPDGRRYPLVVPWFRRNGRRWTADLLATDPATASLDGADPGWRTLAVRTGLDEFGPEATTAEKAAIVTAGIVGNPPHPVGQLRPDLLARLALSPDGIPTLTPGPAAPPAPEMGGTAQMTRSTLAPGPDGGLRWVPDAGEVSPVAPNVVAVADSGLAGLGTARRLDDGRVAAYRVAFEENLDGRFRARLTLYQVLSDGSDTTILPVDASMATDGSLQREPVTYRPPAVPVMRSAPDS